MLSSILRHGSRWPAIAQLFERSVVVVGGDSTTEQVEVTEGAKRWRFPSEPE